MIARVGSMIAPFILQINNTLPWFTQTVFGSLSILSGLATLSFPETNELEWIHTLDQAEEYYRENLPLLKFIKKKKLLQNQFEHSTQHSRLDENTCIAFQDKTQNYSNQQVIS